MNISFMCVCVCEYERADNENKSNVLAWELEMDRRGEVSLMQHI